MPLVHSAVAALVLALVLTPLWMRLAPRLGAVDQPRGRHQHRKPTPTAGGVAIYVAVWAAALVFMPHPLPPPMVGLLVATGLLVALNLRDDIEGLPPLGRLSAQVAISIVAYVWGLRVEMVSNPWGLLGTQPFIELGWLSAPLTVFWIVLVTNALNWLDGLDGLAAGTAGISALTLALMSPRLPMAEVGIVAAAVAGACLGFLRYNFNPARVFMGDTGAMFLGFTLACLSVSGALKMPTAATILLPLLVLGLPVFDSTTAILKRVANGRNPMEGDRSHIHHRLVDRGLTDRQAVLVLYGISGALCLIALWLWWK
jgi:UDP-GlcNAc:undecaprenyl-phosphate/decaprenyl-phosphate GlcNAc-1-phosphate transferase